MDTKAVLKDARNAIKNKDFETALKLSKSVIKQDRNNYMAFVFLGLSLQEVGPLDHTPKAFQKAIDLNPSNPLAWQGLISYYEKLKKNEVKCELLKLYTSYLDIETNETKLVEYSKKLAHIGTLDDVKDISKTLIEISKKCPVDTQIDILKLVADLLETISDGNKPLDLYDNCLATLLDTSAVPENFYSSYLTILNKTNQTSKVLEHSRKMHELFPSNVVALSWICKIFNQMYIEESSELSCNMENIVEYADKLLKLDQKNAMGLFTQAVLLFEKNDVLSAKEKLTEVTTQRPGLVYAWVLLTDVLIRLNLPQEATVSLNKSQKLLRSLSNPGLVIEKVKYQELEILSLSTNHEDWEKAVSIYTQKVAWDLITGYAFRFAGYAMVFSAVQLFEVLQFLSIITLPGYDFTNNRSATLFCSHGNQSNNFRKQIRRLFMLLKYHSCNCVFWIVQDFNCKKCLPAIIKININLEHFVEAEKYISDLKSVDENLAQFYKFCLYKKQRKFLEAKQIVECSTCNFTEWWIEVGLMYWDLEEYGKSLEPFLKAAKCDPNNYICFVCLGHYYNKVGQLDKARRCYEKAFKINSLSSEAGSELSKIYRKQKNWVNTDSVLFSVFEDGNLILLTSLTRGPVDSTNIWAWLQLGLTYLEQGDPVNAMDYLRMVLRLEPKNIHCWESLADAYFSRGAFTSALKCYQKASELSEFSLYPALQVAYIKKILGEFADAQADFENILISNSLYVPALKGLSETCLCQARECFKEQRIGTARDYAQTAVDKVTLAILQRSELTCLWKLLADCVIFAAKIPDKYSFLKISQGLLNTNKSDESVVLEQDELFSFAVKCYCKAVNLAQDNPFLWHDLGTCYLNYASHVQDPERKSELFDCALAAAQHCTTLNPENWQHWNLLGSVAMLKNPPNYAMAQHCFIKAAIAESNSAVAWTNLGILYLLMGDFKLANKAFGEGQRSDPNYVNSWIGQALIAELMGHSDAMDLFRHSTQLGQHQQGSIGYGHWVCHMLLHSATNDKSVQYNIYHMHAIPVAHDNVKWYTEKHPDNACAWNMLGILSERMGLLNSARNAFKYAFVLSDKKHKDVSRVNYGRLLYQTGEYTSAIEMFTNVEEATFSSGAGLALALFRNGQYEESYEAYEQALHWLTEEQAYQSDLLVALASMAYKFQGLDGAKTLLFQSIGLKPPSPWSLYATLSLSLLHDDLKLAQLVLKELVNFETQVNKTEGDYSEYIYHYATLLSCLYVLKNDKKGAVIGLSRLVHKHPNIASTWLILSQLLLKLENDKHRLEAGAKCANIALKMGQTNMDVSKALCIAALSFHRAGDLRQAKLFAQKAVHYYPDLPDGWATLKPLLVKTKNLSITNL